MRRNRWHALIAGTIMLIFLGLLYGWSIFKAPLSSIYKEWTVSNISLTFTISMVCFCLGGFCAGKLTEKLGTRKLLMLSAIILLIGFWGISMLNPEKPKESLILLYLLYGVLCGAGVGIGYNVIISSVNKSFTDKAGLASGIMMMGFGLGAIILGSVVGVLIEMMGLFNTFKVLGVVIAVVLIECSVFLSQNSVTKENNNIREGKSSFEMLKTPEFWIFVIWVVLICSSGLLVINSAASIAIAFGVPAVLGLIVSVFNGVGRVIIGFIFDKFGRMKSMFIDSLFILMAGIFLTIGAICDNVVFILVGLLFTGIGYGGAPALTSAFVMATFGPKNYAVNFSLANFSLIPSAIIGPMISSRMIEASEGSYNSTFIMIIIFAFVSIGTWAVMNKKVKKEE